MAAAGRLTAVAVAGEDAVEERWGAVIDALAAAGVPATVWEDGVLGDGVPRLAVLIEGSARGSAVDALRAVGAIELRGIAAGLCGVSLAHWSEGELPTVVTVAEGLRYAVGSTAYELPNAGALREAVDRGVLPLASVFALTALRWAVEAGTDEQAAAQLRAKLAALAPGVEAEEVASRMTTWGGAACGAAVAALVDGGAGAAALATWLRAAAPTTSALPRAPGAPATSALPVPMAGAGRLIALLGCDGAGKSTTVEALQQWLAPVLRLEPAYLGSGDGPSSWLRRPMVWVLRLLRRRKKAPAKAPEPTTKKTAASEAAPSPERRSWPLRAARVLWALVLSHEKRGKLRAAWRARDAGHVVVSDRYPQNEIMGFNDGPILSAWETHRWGWVRRIAAWERRAYSQAEQKPPDLVLKLCVTEDVSLARRPEMSREEVRRRIDAVQRMRFGGAAIAVIDADAPIEDVQRQVRAALWAALR